MRAALVGFGKIAESTHLPALTQAGFELVAVAEPAAEQRRAAAQCAPQAHLYNDLDALLEAEQLDCVDICTPPHLHTACATAALRKGLHVVCEKPVALTRAEAGRIAAAARASGRVVMPCHQYRYNPVWVRVKEWLAAGAIGPWHLAEFSVYRVAADPGREAGGDGTPWRGTSAAGRGGVLLDHGTHLVYELLDVAGPPQAVRAWTGRLRHGAYDVEDTAQLVFEYPDRMATMFLTWAARRRETEIRFSGERGSITWSGGILTLERNGQTQSFDHTAELDKASYAKWFAELFHDFATTLDTGDGARPLADIAQVAAVLEASYAAVE